MSCGCTSQQPACNAGRTLFAAFIRAGSDLQFSHGDARERAWDHYYQAQIAYQDHLHGWRQGDVRVRIEGEDWVVERHELQGWVLSYVMSVPALLYATLRAQGLWHYAQLGQDQPRDTLTGYYHQRRAFPSGYITTTHLPHVPLHHWRYLTFQQQIEPLLMQMVHRESDIRQMISHLVVHLLPVTRVGQWLTPLEHLHVQRRILGALMASGVDITQLTLPVLTRTINEAVARHIRGPEDTAHFDQ